MPSILVYTFFNYSKKTSKGLYSFEYNAVKFEKLFVSRKLATRPLLARVHEFDYVIGIADHNKNAKQSRFDGRYINTYGKRKVLDNGQQFLNSNLSIALPENFYEFSSVTNGPCNRSGYLVMDAIMRGGLTTRFGFFHLCKETWEDDLKAILKGVCEAG